MRHDAILLRAWAARLALYPECAMHIPDACWQSKTCSYLQHVMHTSAEEDSCLACLMRISAACEHSHISCAPCTCMLHAAAALHLDCAMHILAACQCRQQRQADAWQRLPQGLIDIVLSRCLICSSLPHGVCVMCCAGSTFRSRRASKLMQYAVMASSRQCREYAPAI